MIGTNDIEKKSVEDAVKGIKSLLNLILEKLPKCQLWLLRSSRGLGNAK